MASFFDSLLNEVGNFVKNQINLLGSKISDWWIHFTPIAEKEFDVFVKTLQPIAFGLVTGLAGAAISGREKFDIASKALLSAAAAQGIAATTVMANTLVQQIVASLSLATPPAAK